MRATIAAVIAAAILWAIDVEFNGGHYTKPISHAVMTVIRR
jgi:hypothetical protein